MEAKDLAQWRSDVPRLCGTQKQFATRILLEMAGAMRDAQRRQAEYEQLYAMAGRNDDLACEIRFRQAVDLSLSDKAQEAIDLCRNAAVKHWRSGDGTLLLATTAREIAVRGDKRSALLGLYAQVFAGFTSPRTQAARFTRHTAWRLLGEDYARSLQEEGRDSEAREILEKIGAPAGT